MVQFNDWCKSANSAVGNHGLCLLTGETANLATGIETTAAVVPGHYAAEEQISRALARLGKSAAAALIQGKLPTTKAIRSGDLGEIYATEWIDAHSGGYFAPVKRLRWKDHRNMAMRGDDVIAIRVDPQSQRLRFLKTEAKSRVRLALLGLGVVFELFPTVYAAARIAGAAYLLYLAYGIWKDASTPVEANVEPARDAFRQGFLINLLNPKSVLFAAAVLVAVFPAGIDVVNSLVIVVNHFVVEVAFYTTLAFCLSTEVVAKRYVQAKAYVDRFASVVLGALGLRLLWSRAEVP